MNSRIIYIIIIAIITIIVGFYVALNDFSNNPNEITITGSTSVYPVAQALANAYMTKHPEVKITVSGGDSNVGINDVHSGRADIGTSSRNLTSSESEGLSQYKIGEDAITITVNEKNPITSISLDELSGIYSGRISNWKQLNGKDAPITPVTRELGSGTRVDFEEMVGNTQTKSVITASSTYEALHTVAVSPNTIAYIAQNAVDNQVKVLEVNNIPINRETVTNGSYPLKRPMLFLVKGTPTGTLKDFIDFCLSPEGQNIVNEIEYGSNNNTISQNPGIGPVGG